MPEMNAGPVATGKINGWTDEKSIRLVHKIALQAGAPNIWRREGRNARKGILGLAQLPICLRIVAVEDCPIGATVVHIIEEWRQQRRQCLERKELTAVVVLGNVACRIAADNLVVI